MRSVKTGTEEAIQGGDQAAHTSPGDTHHPLNHAGSHQTTATGLSFIESQFPVSRLSKESYKERKANYSQTLTGLGKWWGRKPLIMVRAVILGLLMPASNDPRRDRDVFLALLTMDEEGLWRRKRRNIPLKEVYRRLPSRERTEWFGVGTDPSRPRLKKGTNAEAKERLQRSVFERMGYDEKLGWCDRPEHVEGPSPEAWNNINEHLGTSARNLPELVRELGERRFGHVPRVGDAFCGGGSVPFEAARIGCEAYGSDLNPVAALLTWGALNIIGGGEEVAERVRQTQTDVFDAVDRQITEWRIEHNDVGWRADAYLYCTEIKCPECGWQVPLAPSWVIGEKTRTVARLIAKASKQRFDIDIRSGVDPDTLVATRKTGTVKESRVQCPNPDCGASTPIGAIRGDQRGRNRPGNKLRLWDNDDLVPQPDDMFQERLYCVRWRLPPLDELLWAEQKARASESMTENASLKHGHTGDLKLSPKSANNQPTTFEKPALSENSLKPVPCSVNLDGAINALSQWLDADEQEELNQLRKRDWRAEDRVLEETQRKCLAMKDEGVPTQRLKDAARQLKELKVGAGQRNARCVALAKSVPNALYRAVDEADIQREDLALALLRERFEAWQALGYIPNRQIATGAKTDEPIRTRGWSHWHHLFTPRQLLVHGELAKVSGTSPRSPELTVACQFGIGRAADWDSKLCRWDASAANEKVAQTFSNQALNTLDSFAGKGFAALANSWYIGTRSEDFQIQAFAAPADARGCKWRGDLWITDPPYADAVNYHELSELFLVWYEKKLLEIFPSWYADSKRALAVQGTEADFRQSMVDCYRNLTAHMPDNGLQVVMFTHQNASVWADLTLILWAAGLRVTAAWTIATETESALKQGNYVQGTVLMVLRKQTSEETVFLDELVPEVESEVEGQLKSMLQLDDRDDPNFSDADYQLAAYAAALRMLTKYGSIEDINVAYQLARERSAGEPNPIEALITNAVRTASNFLVPSGLPSHLWRQLAPEEKLYLKGLEVESHGDFRTGVYQEFARGFGVRDYRFLLQTGKANQTRLKTASEFQRRELGEPAFGRSLVRQALYAVWRAVQSGDTAQSLTWLRTEVEDYWAQREALAAVLRYLAQLEIDHWSDDANAARIVAGAVDNDHV